jgi:hypothetical protein
MSISLSPHPPVAAPTPTETAVRERWLTRAGIAVLVLLLVTALPLFVCMPVWSDVIHYDLCARNILRGGIHYRDQTDVNFPGMVWIHAGLRTLVGWSTEALRIVDILVVCGVVGLLVRWVKRSGGSKPAQVWLAVLLFTFYFWTSEWCHCQRDIWMLLPALLALSLRQQQVEGIVSSAATGRVLAGRAVVEGLLWGAAVWIKPFVVIPAFVCWLAGAAWAGDARVPGRVRLLALDTGFLIGGGLVAGFLGIAWLQASGTWPYFLNVILHENQDYYAAAASGQYFLRTIHMIQIHSPWCLTYLLAVPLAVVWLGRGLAVAWPHLRDSIPAVTSYQVLLSALFLGWFLQVAYLQMHHEYVLVPPILLAVTVLVVQSVTPTLAALRVVLLLGVVLVALPRHPLLDPGRLALWPRCWREGSSPDLRNRLTMSKLVLLVPDWVALEQVADYLRGQELHDGELTCFDGPTTPLYLELGVRPPTRTLHFDMLFLSPGAAEPLRQQLNASPQRFVISDLECINCPNREPPEFPDGPLSLPPGFPRGWAQVYPWSEPIVFRAGRYQVHRVTGPVQELFTGIESIIYPKKKGEGPKE